jgi:hypothetical protein
VVSTTKKYMPNRIGMKIRAEMPKVASKEIFWIIAPAMVWLRRGQYGYTINGRERKVPKKHTRS